MPMTRSVLDVRPLPPPQRHARIFALLDELAPDEELILINDHDPKPLRYQVQTTQPDCFAWESHETAPREWTVHIQRLQQSPPLGEARLPARLPHLSPLLAAGKLVSHYPASRQVLARFNLAPAPDDPRPLRDLAREAGLDPEALMAALVVALAR